VRRMRAFNRQLPRQPIQDIRSQPTDLAPVIPTPLRKTAQQYQARNDEFRATREARYVMGAEKLLEGKRRFIDPAGERHSRAGGRDNWITGR